MRKLAITLLLLPTLIFIVPTAVGAQEGVHVSRPLVHQEVDDILNEFVRRVVIASVLEDTGKLVGRIVNTQQLPIYPQIAGLAVQQISLQVFKHEELMEICREAFDDSLLLLKEERASGQSQEVIKNSVRNNTKEILQPIYDHRLYHRIVEELIKQSLREQQRIIIMSTAQRQVQMMAIQQQINQIKQAALQSYMAGIGSQPAQ